MGQSASSRIPQTEGPGYTYDSQTGKVLDARPRRYAVSSAKNFTEITNRIYQNQSTVTKTVVLPPGVSLNDPRLANGVVVEERCYELGVGEELSWPDSHAFEADIDGRLLPKRSNTHFSVYPDERFAKKDCRICKKNAKLHPSLYKKDIENVQPQTTKMGSQLEAKITKSFIIDEGISVETRALKSGDATTIGNQSTTAAISD